MEKYPQPIFDSRETRKHLSLTPEQKNTVRGVTLGIEEVDETVRSLALEDVVTTLENGHPLNRLITNKEGNTVGFIACEDFIPHEAYIKYFGTTGETGRSMLEEIPAFLEYAKNIGYTKINFHGWNDRLNRVLTRYGFKRVRTDKMADYAVDFYEKELTEQKSTEDVEKERREAFEQKYINKINQEYENTLTTFSQKEGRENNRAQKEKLINDTFQTLSTRLEQNQDFEFGQRQKAILKLKLARYFQTKDTIDLNTLYDAIIESPKYINTDKGSLHKLFETHEQKTLQRIAEIRKNRAEIKGNEGFNPYENLFTTKSGNYYVARLLNMPHLEEESEYMKHCVGTSDSYINQMKRGDIEILSFRHAPRINSELQKLEGDIPIITIEYNLKTKTIEQMKKANDKYLEKSDPYYADVIDALKQLRQTKTDTGEMRDYKRINPSELNKIEVKDYHILTEQGEVSLQDFNPDEGVFVLKTGNMEITKETPKTDVVKIMQILEGIKIKPEELAYTIEEITENTKAYLGPWNPTIYNKVKNFPNTQHLYESFPDKKIFTYKLETNPQIDSPEKAEEELKARGIYITDWGHDILQKTEWSGEGKTYNLVQFTVGQLGFPQGATTDQIYAKAKELGLDLCPAEVGPHLRLSYPGGDWKIIAMEQVTDRYGYPYVFFLYRDGDELVLDGYYAEPSDMWGDDGHFVFLARK